DGAPNINYRRSYVDGSAIPASEINNPFIKNPMVSPLVTTSYLVQTDSLPAVCKTRDTVIVFIDNLNGIEISPSEDPVVVCRDGYLPLDANGKGPKPLTNLECGTGTPATGVPVINNLGNIANFSNTHSPFQGGTTRSVRTQYIIRKGELHNLGILSSTFFSIGFNFVAPTATDPFENITIKMKCTDQDGFVPSNGFESGAVTVYNAPGPLSFVNGWNSFQLDNPYNWD